MNPDYIKKIKLNNDNIELIIKVKNFKMCETIKEENKLIFLEVKNIIDNIIKKWM